MFTKGYGESERIIGNLLKETPEEQKKNVIIATKCGSLRDHILENIDLTCHDQRTGLPMPNPMNWSFFTPGIEHSLRESLKRLGVDSVELYQVSRRRSLVETIT